MTGRPPPRTPPKSIPLPSEPDAPVDQVEAPLPEGHVQCLICQAVVRREAAALASELGEAIEKWACGRCIQDEEEAALR